MVFQENQSQSLIGLIRDCRGLVSSMVMLSIFFFLFTFYSPSIQAAIENLDAEVVEQAIQGKTSEEKLINVLLKIKQDVSRYKDKIGNRVAKESDFWDRLLNYFGWSPLKGESLDDVVALSQMVVKLNDDVLTGFAQMEGEIKAGKFPEAILERHRETVKQYNHHYEKLQQNFQQLQSAESLVDQKDAVETLDAYLKEQQFKRHHQAVDPEDLPFGYPKIELREPLTNYQALKQMLDIDEHRPAIVKTLLQSMVADAYAQNTHGPQPEDLLETPDVQMTQAIRDLAAQLNHDVIQIYAWVHNNIRFIPGYGSLQGSHLTLINRQGNAFDTASLLIALLRASGIPARYAYGTVDIPADKLMNWVGGAATIEAAQSLIAQGGIPNTARVAGGRIVSVKMEHVWAEAWVDYEPSRAAINLQGDAWVPMDGSFKQYQFTNGSNVLTDIPFDYDGLYDQISQTTTVDSYFASVGGLKEGQSVITDYIENYRQQLEVYLDANAPNKTVDEIFGALVTNVIAPKNLSAGLPYDVIAQADAFSVIPAHMRHTITLKGYQSFGSGFAGLGNIALGSPVFSYQVSMPELNSKRFAIRYEPATDADRTAFNNIYAGGGSRLPLYLLNVKPVISIDGETVLTGETVKMGQAQQLEVLLGLGSRVEREVFEITAGDEIVVGANGGGINPAVVNEYSSSTHTTASENLHQVALSYWLLCDYFNQAVAKALNVVSYRQPSVGIFSSPLTVNYFFGIPRSGKYQSRVMDVPHSVLSVGAQTQEQARNFMFQAGVQGSYFEGATFDLLFGNYKGSGISAIQLLMDANFEDQTIYEVTSNNINDVLPMLAIDNDVRADIINSVSAGKTVLVPRGDIRRGDWSGIGYIILDKKTGAGAYLISGGLNGGADNECEPSLVPIIVAVVLTILLALIAVYLAGLLAAAAAGAATAAGGAAALAIRALIASFATLLGANAAYANPLDEPCTCSEHYAACMEAGLGGTVGNDSACYACFQRCQGQGGWPDSITIIITGGISVTVSCNY